MFKNLKEMFETVDKWSARTFGEEYNDWVKTCTNTALQKAVSLVLTEQNLWNHKMLGSASERRKVTETENLGIKYAHIPEKLVEENGFWNPFYVIVYTCKHCLDRPYLYNKCKRNFKENIVDSNDLMVRMCGRALRGMPSPLREDQVAAECATRYSAENVDKSLQLDLLYHCDVKVIYKGRIYFIWSTMQTQGATANLVSKFTTGRGTPLPAGRHILCMFDRNDPKNLKYKNWELFSKEFFNQLFDLIENDTYYTYEEYTQNMLDKVRAEKGPVMILNRYTRCQEV